MKAPKQKPIEVEAEPVSEPLPKPVEMCSNCVYWKRLGQAVGRCDARENQVFLDQPMVRNVHVPVLTTDMDHCSIWMQGR